MYVVDQERDRRTLIRIDILAGLPPLLHQLLVELDKQKGLVLNSSEQVVVSDEIENIRSPKTKIVWQRFAWLTVSGKPGTHVNTSSVVAANSYHSQFCQAFHQNHTVRRGCLTRR